MRADGKFDAVCAGALDFGLDLIFRGYKVGVVVFSDRTLATNATGDSVAFTEKIRRLVCTSGGTYLTSALEFVAKHKPDSVLVVTDGAVQDAAQCLVAADRLKAMGAEIRTIGTDDANRKFLKRLASRPDLGKKVPRAELAQAIIDTSKLLR